MSPSSLPPPFSYTSVLLAIGAGIGFIAYMCYLRQYRPHMIGSPIANVIGMAFIFLIIGFLSSGSLTGGILTDVIWLVAFGISAEIVFDYTKGRRPLIRNLIVIGHMIYISVMTFVMVHCVWTVFSFEVFPRHMLEFSALVFLLILPALAVLILVRR